MPDVIEKLKQGLMPDLDEASSKAFDDLFHTLSISPGRGGPQSNFELCVALFHLIEARLFYHVGKQGK